MKGTKMPPEELNAYQASTKKVTDYEYKVVTYYDAGEDIPRHYPSVDDTWDLEEVYFHLNQGDVEVKVYHLVFIREKAGVKIRNLAYDLSGDPEDKPLTDRYREFKKRQLSE